ncbi:acyltransferase family protein [Vampirovibrio sp.]|uniref:acyltransferase family protein n=1 Tax=Vampirovibrio sp. TaxID=2717857 RepID=UPI003593444A
MNISQNISHLFSKSASLFLSGDTAWTTQKIPYGKLQAFRGILALNVAIAHCLGVFAIDMQGTGLTSHHPWQAFQTDAIYWLQLLATGSSSVALFFVLSGFVLGLSLNRAPIDTLKGLIFFYVRRVLRIWPAYAVSLLLILTFLFTQFQYHQWPFASQWFTSFYTRPLTTDLILSNALMADTSLNSNTWSLKVEMIGSLFIPLFFWYARKTRANTVTLG